MQALRNNVLFLEPDKQGPNCGQWCIVIPYELVDVCAGACAKVKAVGSRISWVEMLNQIAMRVFTRIQEVALLTLAQFGLLDNSPYGKIVHEQDVIDVVKQVGEESDDVPDSEAVFTTGDALSPEETEQGRKFFGENLINGLPRTQRFNGFQSDGQNVAKRDAEKA